MYSWVVKQDLCIGCGVCAATCPKGLLAIQFNRFGELVAQKSPENCPASCSKCLDCCPFSPSNSAAEDDLAAAAFAQHSGVQHRPETGFFLAAYSGYLTDDAARLSRSSGGLATYVLRKLLTTGYIDRVAAVFPTGDPNRLFEYRVAKTPDELMQASKSAYYPVELSGVIRQVLNGNHRWAIVGLPCFLKAIRLSARSSARLRSRIAYLVGLVCGHTKSRSFTNYCALHAGILPPAVHAVEYRLKVESRPANDFAFCFSESTPLGLRTKNLARNEGPEEAWYRGYFKPTACNFCDDVFSETADVCFMDAWIEPAQTDSKGTSLVVSRHPDISGILETGYQEKDIHLLTVDIQTVIASQSGVSQIKRDRLQSRLELRRLMRGTVLRKRFEARGPKDNKRTRLLTSFFEELIRKASRRAMVDCVSLAVFRRRMAPSILLWKTFGHLKVRLTGR